MLLSGTGYHMYELRQRVALGSKGEVFKIEDTENPQNDNLVAKIINFGDI